MPGKKKPKKEEIDPGDIPMYINRLFENLDMGINPGMSTTTSVSQTAAEATLTEEDIVHAMRMLKGEPSYGLPPIDIKNASWALAMAMVLIKFFEVRLSEKNFMSSAMFSNMLRLDMRFPFGRDAFTQSTTQVLDRTSSYSKEPEKLLQMRMMLLQNMLHKQFDAVEIWIDIAKRAKHEYKVEDILKIENIEQRMAALRIFGADRLIEETQAKCVSKSKRGNELYLIKKEKGFFTEDAYFLKYQCVSTGRIYVSGVPSWLFNQQVAAIGLDRGMQRDMEMPGFGMMWGMRRGPEVESKYMKDYHTSEWADLAMAWKFRLTLEEYKRLSRENEG